MNKRTRKKEVEDAAIEEHKTAGGATRMREAEARRGLGI